MVPAEPEPTVLFVCTANVCRSPMAEALLAGRLRELGASARVRSAGLRALGGRADEYARQALASRGLALSDHRSTSITVDDIAEAELIVAMERAHVAEISATQPDAFAKTFGLIEIVALGEQHGGRGGDETLNAWIERMHRGRRPADVLRADSSFDIADPHGGTLAAYEQCADRLGALVDALARLLALPVDAPST